MALSAGDPCAKLSPPTSTSCGWPCARLLVKVQELAFSVPVCHYWGLDQRHVLNRLQNVLISGNVSRSGFLKTVLVQRFRLPNGESGHAAGKRGVQDQTAQIVSTVSVAVSSSISPFSTTSQVILHVRNPIQNRRCAPQLLRCLNNLRIGTISLGIDVSGSPGSNCHFHRPSRSTSSKRLTLLSHRRCVQCHMTIHNL